MASEPTWRDLVERVDDGDDDTPIFDRRFACQVDGCAKTEPILGEGPTAMHVRKAHAEQLRPGPRGHDEGEGSGLERQGSGGLSLEQQPAQASQLEERRPSRWAPPKIQDRPKPRSRPPGRDDVDEELDEDLEHGERGPDRDASAPVDDELADERPAPVVEPEEFVPVAQAIRERLDQGLIDRGADEGDLPPVSYREKVDLEAARVLAKYMPTYGEEINLAFLLIIGYGPVIYGLRQQRKEASDETTRGMEPEDAQRLEQDEGEISSAAKQEFLEALA